MLDLTLLLTSFSISFSTNTKALNKVVALIYDFRTPNGHCGLKRNFPNEVLFSTTASSWCVCGQIRHSTFQFCLSPLTFRIPQYTANIYNHITSFLHLKRCYITAKWRVLLLAVLQYSYSTTTILLIVVFITTFCMNS